MCMGQKTQQYQQDALRVRSVERSRQRVRALAVWQDFIAHKATSSFEPAP
jgi:hypothetical protein